MIDLQKRKEECFEQIKTNPPELIHPSGIIDILKVKKNKNSPKGVLEYYFWRELSGERYWNAFNNLKLLFEQGSGDMFSGEELGEITNVMIKQTLEGKMTSSYVPMYSDVFKLI